MEQLLVEIKECNENIKALECESGKLNRMMEYYRKNYYSSYDRIVLTRIHTRLSDIEYEISIHKEILELLHNKYTSKRAEKYDDNPISTIDIMEYLASKL